MGRRDGGSQACMWWLMLLICKGKEMEGQACMWWLMLLICNGKEGWREPSLHMAP